MFVFVADALAMFMPNFPCVFRIASIHRSIFVMLRSRYSKDDVFEMVWCRSRMKEIDMVEADP